MLLFQTQKIKNYISYVSTGDCLTFKLWRTHRGNKNKNFIMTLQPDFFLLVIFIGLFLRLNRFIVAVLARCVIMSSAADWFSLLVFRDYITAETGNLSEEQKHGCLNALSALRDCGYRYLTCPLHVKLKVRILYCSSNIQKHAH